MVYSGNEEDVVQGQVWEINESTKVVLDVLEGVGTPPQQTTAWPGFPVSPYRRQTFVWCGKTIYSYVLDTQTFSLDAYPKLAGGIWKGGLPLMPTHSQTSNIIFQEQDKRRRQTNEDREGKWCRHQVFQV